METKELRPLQKLMVDAVKKHCIVEGDFTLAAGGKTKWYMIGRNLTFRGDSIELIGQSIMDALRAAEEETGKNLTNFDAVGGLVVGAIPVAVAVAAITGKNSFAVRKEAKDHGDSSLIAGPLEKGQKVLIVEDTVTTGGSLIQAIDACEAFGCEVVAVAAIHDRNNVITAKCAERGLPFVSVITAEDLGFEFGS